VKVYENADQLMSRAISGYVSEVKSNDFPSREHSFTMNEEEVAALYGGKK